MNRADKRSFELTEDEWQVVLDALSNTVFNEEISEEARKKQKTFLSNSKKSFHQNNMAIE